MIQPYNLQLTLKRAFTLGFVGTALLIATLFTGCEKGLENVEILPTCEAAGGLELTSCNCPRVLDPVCGCDRVTYGNSCEAECAGVPSYVPGACR